MSNRTCVNCGDQIVGPDNEDAHDNRDRCVGSLRAQLSAARARWTALRKDAEHDRDRAYLSTEPGRTIGTAQREVFIRLLERMDELNNAAKTGT